MSKRRFSIVIPTRQRHETLLYAIQTILNQTFDDFELIICDNCSSPETREVVESFADARIRYVRSETSLAMTDNWELAVSHAQGEFITVIGDDDGLLKHGLAIADQVLRELNSEVLHYKQVTYLWPSYLLPKQANQLTIPVNTVDRVLTAKKVFKQLFHVDYWTFNDLPEVYNSFIHHGFLDQMRQKTGRVFHSFSPDVYSGVVIAHLAQRYHSIGLPLGIAGSSGKSNGASVILDKAQDIIQDNRALYQKGGWKIHEDLPNSLGAVTAIFDAFLTAKSNFFPDSTDYPINQKQLAKWIYRDLYTRDETVYRQHLQTVYDWLSDPEIKKWFQETRMQAEFKMPELDVPFVPRIYTNALIVDASQHNIATVEDVANFYAKLFFPANGTYQWNAAAVDEQSSRWQRAYQHLRSAARILVKDAHD